MKQRRQDPVYRITINGLELEELKKRTWTVTAAGLGS